MASRILVTGATGSVGSEVVRMLRERDHDVVAALRRPNRSGIRWGTEVERVRLDLMRPETFEAAFSDVDAVFLVRPTAMMKVDKQLGPVIEAARRLGVKHVVFLSLLGVDSNPEVPHYGIEKFLQSTGITYTFLRPGFFMQNLSTVHQGEIRDRDEVFIPAGLDKTSFIDARDLGSIAVKVLTEPGHENRIYRLAGDQVFDYYQVAELFSQVLGRQISYRNPSLFRFVNVLHRNGLPMNTILVMSSIYMTAQGGLAESATDDLPRLLGRDPITLKQFMEDYQACWKPRLA
jgi:uncharacterized protein YbjT (DUF2867 family)